jgi:hypothetical protein
VGDRHFVRFGNDVREKTFRGAGNALPASSAKNWISSTRSMVVRTGKISLQSKRKELKDLSRVNGTGKRKYY